jgi:hypothetical protein
VSQSQGASPGSPEPLPSGQAPWGVPYPPSPVPPPPRRLAGKLWLLLLVPPFAITTWAAFLYIGIRARRAQWLAFAVLYAAMFVTFVVLDSPRHPGSTAEGVATGLGLLAWIGGGIHAIAVSGDASRRIQRPGDPLLEAGKARIRRRAEGRRLLATQPALAREVGLGRPDVPGADDYGLVDVNHASAAGLQRIPGVTAALARRIVGQREQCGGFSSVEDLGLVLDLPPGAVEQMRDVAVFIPD